MLHGFKFVTSPFSNPRLILIERRLHTIRIHASLTLDLVVYHFSFPLLYNSISLTTISTLNHTVSAMEIPPCTVAMGTSTCWRAFEDLVIMKQNMGTIRLCCALLVYIISIIYIMSLLGGM